MANMEVTTEVEKKIEEYRDKVENYFWAYVAHSQMSDLDPFDPLIPGVSEEFIMNRSITDIEFDGYPLQTNYCSKLHVLCKPGKSVVDSLAKWIEDTYPDLYLHHISGHFYYPKENGFMGWHTNSDQPGYRIYLSHCKEGGKSFFRYLDSETHEVVTTWDDSGWNARIFKTPGNPENYYWHCVYSETDRLSIGMELKRKIT